jgi:hypothetical protein
MPDLTSFLVTHFLEETIAGAMAPQESDASLQYLESLFAGEHADAESDQGQVESRLIHAFLEFGVEELESLSPGVTQWFLERLALRPPLEMQWGREDVAQRIGRLFFLSEWGTQRYLVIGALLAFDERLETREVSSVSFIWDHIWRDEGLAKIAKNTSISDVAEILLDQYYFCHQSRYPLQALGQLVSTERQVEGDLEPRLRPAYGKVLARAHLVGETLASDLLNILGGI